MATKLGIVSGDNSRDFWAAINNINAMSTGDDIHNILYWMGCKMQEIEAEIEDLIDGKD